MTDSAPKAAWPDRNGFALRADLGHPALARLREQCLAEDRELTGRGHLDWSRQWEYPWALAHLPERAEGRRVLEAGSGYRFFTPMIARRGYQVQACDLDGSIGPKLKRVAREQGLAIEFSTEDLEHMSYGDGTFDFVTCISVLEHTACPPAVAREFARCLAPGGTLLLTFDVSLRGDRDIPVARARDLVRQLETDLEPLHPFTGREWLEDGALDRPEVRDQLLWTGWFRDHAPELLPWRLVSRAGLANLKQGRLGRPFFELVVVAMALRKPIR